MNILLKIIIIITLVIFWAVLFYFLSLVIVPIDNRYGIGDLIGNNTAIKENFIKFMNIIN